MKLKNYFLGLSVAVMGLLTSCNQDNEGPVYEGTTMGVTFAINAQSVSFPATGYEGFDVEVIRAVYLPMLILKPVNLRQPSMLR